MKKPVDRIEPDPEQPRKFFEESDVLGMGQNLLTVGQQVPVIVYEVLAADGGVQKWRLVDGERRWRAALMVGIKELDAVVLPAKPSPLEKLIAQASIDLHRASLRATERCDLIARVMTEGQLTQAQVAEKLGIKQPTVAKLLSLQKLIPEVRAKLDAGELDIERASILAAQPPEQQKALLGLAHLPREQLRQKTKASGEQPKAPSVRLPMPGGYVLALSGGPVTLNDVIQVMAECLRMLKKAQGQNYNVTTVAKMFRDQVKAR